MDELVLAAEGGARLARRSAAPMAAVQVAVAAVEGVVDVAELLLCRLARRLLHPYPRPRQL